MNRIPPEILALIPDFRDPYASDDWVISLTHVCRAWRDVFVSRPSLWTDIYCGGMDKTCVYLERSKSSPINLTLMGYHESFSATFFKFIPPVVWRLKYLYIDPSAGDLQTITTHLSRPAPLLEELLIFGGRNSVLAPKFLNGDLSSLRKLDLVGILTGSLGGTWPISRRSDCSAWHRYLPDSFLTSSKVLPTSAKLPSSPAP